MGDLCYLKVSVNNGVIVYIAMNCGVKERKIASDLLYPKSFRGKNEIKKVSFDRFFRHKICLKYDKIIQQVSYVFLIS